MTLFVFVAAAAEPATIVPSDFELKSPPMPLRVTPEDCRRTAAAGEIVVCGRSPDHYRVKELKPPKGIEIDAPGVVGLDMGSARVEPQLQQVQMPDGRFSKRVMVTVKVPF
ncbi:MAG TPA: hypothetical protein VE053_02965 [Allosphingosinicella sp.]|nr:hypothetical protein [Allosphingosinicella sp.]